MKIKEAKQLVNEDRNANYVLKFEVDVFNERVVSVEIPDDLGLPRVRVRE